MLLDLCVIVKPGRYGYQEATAMKLSKYLLTKHLLEDIIILIDEIAQENGLICPEITESKVGIRMRWKYYKRFLTLSVLENRIYYIVGHEHSSMKYESEVNHEAIRDLFPKFAVFFHEEKYNEECDQK